MEKFINKKTAFHIHTKYSYDSNLDPTEVIDRLVKGGYEQVIITDHDSIEGALIAKEYADKNYSNEIQVVIGEEVSTDIGDIIGFPIIEVVLESNYYNCIKEIKKQNGYVCLPHPYKGHDLFRIHTQQLIDQIDFVEIFNARLNPKLNSYAAEFAKHFKKHIIVGSDAHISKELINTCFLFNDIKFSLKIISSKYSQKRYIRESQYIKYLSRKHYSNVIKYYILSILNI